MMVMQGRELNGIAALPWADVPLDS